jgi:hypothetical protein
VPQPWPLLVDVGRHGNSKSPQLKNSPPGKSVSLLAPIDYRFFIGILATTPLKC